MMDGITDGNAFVEHQRKEIIVVRSRRHPLDDEICTAIRYISTPERVLPRGAAVERHHADPLTKPFDVDRGRMPLVH